MELEGIIIGRTQTLLKDDAPGEGGYDETACNCGLSSSVFQYYLATACSWLSK